IHILQLESYQNNMYLKWVKNNFAKGNLLIINVTAAICAVVTAVFWYALGLDFMGAVCGIFCCGIAGYSIYDYYTAPKKKPLVITDRVKRLFVALMTVTALLILLFNSIIGDCTYLNILLLILFAPFVVLIANLTAYPFEGTIKMGYLNNAKSILRKREDLIKIGITGSYGKTSTKFILNTILSEKYNSLCSPESYNTPMGLTRVVREMLTDEHEVFIAEMGARYVKDIKVLCDLVHPKYGLISSIGKQHLETFKTLENIIETKYDLIKALPEDGIGYLPNDGDICIELAKRKDDINKKIYSLDKMRKACVWAEDIVIDETGSSFDVVTKEKGSIRVNTCLLGEHNIRNILGSVAVALDLDLTLEQIKAGIEKIKPIEHRLQLINSGNGVIVIDDAFNANPEGTKAALKVISQFKGRKIIVTSGLVELGNETESLNKSFGRDIAQNCDIAVLVGKSFSKFIKEGLLEEGFDEGAIVEYETLEEVTNFIGAFAEPGDVVLFENDLPDNYS
ncbi:MAG: UDP-N-acetylmuramoyl-tripeptide--D-alanyl-D-alanine ligase, partial [Clostridia bacterium]|nr:UDP-N-acetylmuramoyl-tripeptide--D-alanyl-D-alanine ligase [Clostridia bacterium]